MLNGKIVLVQKGPDVAKKEEILLTLIEQVMTNLLKKLAF